MNDTCRPALPQAWLIAAYRSSDFIAGVPAEITLCIDRSVPDLDDWLLSRGHRSCAIVTAFNPFSQPLADAENAGRNGVLHSALVDAGLSWIPAVGQSRGRQGPVGEPSFCIFDAPLELIDHWMIEFRQNAVVIAELDHACNLRWHPAIRDQMVEPSAS